MSRANRIIGLLIFVLILSISALTGLAQETPFNYDPAKIKPGTMYYYKLYSSSEADQQAKKQFYYIRSSGQKSSTIEVLNLEFYEQGVAPYLNTYKMSWDKMMLESATWQYIGDKNDLPVGHILHGEMEFNFGENRATWHSKKLAKEGINHRSASTKFKVPTYFYFSNHLDGWTAMRFYPYPKNKIEIQASTGFHLNRVEVKYKGEERIKVPAGEIRCHKFLMRAKGILARLFGKKAWMWMSAEDKRSYMVRYKNKNGRGHLSMVDLRLAKVKKISIEEWEKKVERWGVDENADNN